MAPRMSGLRRLNMFIPRFRPLIVRRKDRAERAAGHRPDGMKNRIIPLGGWLGHEEPFPFRGVVLLLTIVLAFFVPWPWNPLVPLGGVLLAIGEVLEGLRLARRGRP